MYSVCMCYNYGTQLTFNDGRHVVSGGSVLVIIYVYITNSFTYEEVEEVAYKDEVLKGSSVVKVRFCRTYTHRSECIC